MKVYRVEGQRFQWVATYSYESSVVMSLIFHDHLLFVATTHAIYLHAPLVTGPTLPSIQLSRLLKTPLQLV